MPERKKVDARGSVRVVTSNNFLRAAGLEKTSLKARKLLYIAMSQSKKTDTGFFEYAISAQEFAKLMDTSVQNVYQDADTMTDELMKGFIKIDQRPEGKGFLKFSLFEECSYANATLTFKMSKDMTPILLGLKKDFSKPLLADFLQMNSNYSIEIWHLMQQYMHSAKPGISDQLEFDISLDELRRITGTENKLKKVSQFKARVLDQAIKEISERCGVNITYDNLKTGRSVTGFHFIAKNVIHYDADAETLAKIEDFKRRNKV